MVLYVYGQISAKLDKIDIQETDLQEQDIVTNDQAPQMTGYTTYALFGLDHRSKNEKLNTENSDTIIIASINNDTKAVKLVSVYRDTLLNVKDDTYSKANAAYALGGPAQAVNMLNTNLDLNITDYVSIDFDALVTVIDCLGGLDIPLVLCGDRSYEQLLRGNCGRDWQELYTGRAAGAEAGRSGSDCRNLSSEWCTGYFLLPYPLYGKPGYGTYRETEKSYPDDR